MFRVYFLYKTYYIENKSLTFCGFRKPHPHINKSIIRIAFKEEAPDDNSLTTGTGQFDSDKDTASANIREDEVLSEEEEEGGERGQRGQ